MAIHFMDSTVFSDSVGTPQMREIFKEQSMFQRWLEVEAALARAQASLGMIPEKSAERIAEGAQIKQIDLNRVKSHGKETGHSLMGLLREFRALVGLPDAGYIHWGATTQDIIDTGQMLQIKEALGRINDQIRGVLKRWMPLMDEHRETVMAGRTHGQQALPITFGFKIAIWMDELGRHVTRLGEMRERVLVGNITGAVGTFAPWGSKGFEVQSRTLDLLGLGVPDSCWHAARDRLAEIMNFLGLVASSCSRIAREVYNLSKTEFWEIEEPFTPGKIGSSTMPHKRNPVHCEWVLVLTRIIRSNAALAMEAMVQENERDASAWKTEWIIIPESCVMLSGVLAHLDSIFNGLIVRKDRMGKNMQLLRGLLNSEAVMFVLNEFLPLPEAHEKVYEASMKAFEKESSLAEELLADPEIARRCDRQKLDFAMKPENYIGLCRETIDRVKEKVFPLIGPR